MFVGLVSSLVTSQETARRETRTPGAKSRTSEGSCSKAQSVCISYFPTGGYRLSATINGVRTPLLLDTGAAVTLLHKDTWDKVNSHSPQRLTPWSVTRLMGADGSPHRREEVRTLLDDMLKNRAVEPLSSPWASPIVLVPKKDGSTRFCVDYRCVNSVTRKDAYPLPRIDATLDTLAGSQWFSTLDLLSGTSRWRLKKQIVPKLHSAQPKGYINSK